MMQLLINELYQKLIPQCIYDILEQSWPSRAPKWQGCVPNLFEPFGGVIMHNCSYWNRQKGDVLTDFGANHSATPCVFWEITAVKKKSVRDIAVV